MFRKLRVLICNQETPGWRSWAWIDDEKASDGDVIKSNEGNLYKEDVYG